jgi:hypothetical protein
MTGLGRKAVRPLSSSDHRKQQFVQVAGQGPKDRFGLIAPARFQAASEKQMFKT